MVTIVYPNFHSRFRTYEIVKYIFLGEIIAFHEDIWGKFQLNLIYISYVKGQTISFKPNVKLQNFVKNRNLHFDQNEVYRFVVLKKLGQILNLRRITFPWLFISLGQNFTQSAFFPFHDKWNTRHSFAPWGICAPNLKWVGQVQERCKLTRFRLWTDKVKPTFPTLSTSLSWGY